MRDKSKKRHHPVFMTDEQFEKVNEGIKSDGNWDTVTGRKASFAGVGKEVMELVGKRKITSAMVKKMKGGS